MKINSTNFGSITIDGTVYEYDVTLSHDGTVRKRNKKRSGRIHGHRELAQIEIEELIEEHPEILIIGLGQSGRLPISETTSKYLQDVLTSNDIKLIKGKTPDILNETNEALSTGKRVVSIFHVTC